MGEEAVELVRTDRVPPHCQRGSLRIFRTFVFKLAKVYPDASMWVRAEHQRRPTADLQYIIERLDPRPPVDVLQFLPRYLKSEALADYNTLRFSVPADGPLFDLLDDELFKNPELVTLRRIIKMMGGMDNRRRAEVLNLVTRHWETLAKADYRGIVGVVSNHGLPNDRIRKQVVDLLQDDLGSESRADFAREGLEKLLR